MKAALPPYPAYKDSGIPWLGNVPEHWDMRRFKYILREQDFRSSNGNEQLLRVSQYTGVTERRAADDSDDADTRAATLVGYKCVAPGDLVVNIMLAWNGSLGVSLYSGIASPAYCVYRFMGGAAPWYYHYLLRSPLYKSRIKSVSTGVVESRLRLYTDDLFRLEALLPPLYEQVAIVKFLDYMDRRIRRYVGAKKKLIKLLEEQKQAIIHHAVTRGLDHDVRLKPSGVEWLGDVPEHWEVKALKHWVSMNVKVLPETTPPDFQLRYVDIGSVETGLLKNPPRCITFESAPSRARRILRSGDTIVSTVRTYLKAVWLVTADDDALIASTGFAVLTPGSMADPKFVSYTVQSNALMDQIAAESVGTTYPAIAEGRLASSKIAVPPLHEQAAIVRFLDNSTAHIDATISRTKQEISLLSEYRTRLIADVVTGKLDVRKVAANLPDEPIESEQLDEDNVLVVDDDFEGNDDDIDEELEEVEA